jgi:ubiquinone/menaquinone biosynthesis C-methylase UbiE
VSTASRDVATEVAPPSPWEEAYARFETPEEERRKFLRRLSWLGAQDWPKESQIVEIFCGRGNGIHALEILGFRQLEGVDLSPALLAQYHGPAKTHAADCRHLPFEDRSRDILIVQGGLHHLEGLPDVEQTLAEVARVLRPGGRFVAVEPWRTPFLDLVHFVSEQPLVRKVSNKMDAFATMTHYERATYERWLGAPEPILAALAKRFSPERQRIGWGKLMYVGNPRRS